MLRLLILLLFACPLAAQAEMAVERDGDPIADGGNDTAVSTGTSPFNLTYTILNTGAGGLALTGTPEVAISGEVNCTVTLIVPPATTVAAAGSTTFILQVSPVSAVACSFALSIDNDDADENPYNFTFNGNPNTPSESSGGGKPKDSCSSSEASGLGPLFAIILTLLIAAGRALRLARND